MRFCDTNLTFVYIGTLVHWYIGKPFLFHTEDKLQKQRTSIMYYYYAQVILQLPTPPSELSGRQVADAYEGKTC